MAPQTKARLTSNKGDRARRRSEEEEEGEDENEEDEASVEGSAPSPFLLLVVGCALLQSTAPLPCVSSATGDAGTADFSCFFRQEGGKHTPRTEQKAGDAGGDDEEDKEGHRLQQREGGTGGG